MIKGIDVAKWQGTIDWKKVKEDEVQFAILKVIDKSSSTESSFERNYMGATEQKLLVGVYNYSYATTVAKAQADAQATLAVLKRRKLQCKIWLDVEDKCQQKLEKKLIDIILAYQKVIENAGYEFGVYTGLSFYNSYIKPYNAMINCPFWIARYPSSKKIKLIENPLVSKKPVILHPLWGWQYASTGSVSGINGNVDINIMYSDIEKENGIAKPSNPYQEPTYTLYRYRPLMNKEYVKWLQYELNEIGCGLAIDGIFGKNTDFALRSAQSRFEILVDGKCGKDTRNKLKKQ